MKNSFNSSWSSFIITCLLLLLLLVFFFYCCLSSSFIIACLLLLLLLIFFFYCCLSSFFTVACLLFLLLLIFFFYCCLSFSFIIACLLLLLLLVFFFYCCLSSSFIVAHLLLLLLLVISSHKLVITFSHRLYIWQHNHQMHLNFNLSWNELIMKTRFSCKAYTMWSTHRVNMLSDMSQLINHEYKILTDVLKRKWAEWRKKISLCCSVYNIRVNY